MTEMENGCENKDGNGFCGDFTNGLLHYINTFFIP